MLHSAEYFYMITPRNCCTPTLQARALIRGKWSTETNLQTHDDSRVLFCHWVDQNNAPSSAPARKALGKSHSAHQKVLLVFTGWYQQLNRFSTSSLTGWSYPVFPCLFFHYSSILFFLLLTADIFPITPCLMCNLRCSFKHSPISGHWGPYGAYPWMFLQTSRGFKTRLRFSVAFACWQHISLHLSFLRKGRFCHLFRKENFCLFLHIPFLSFPRRKYRFYNRNQNTRTQKSKVTCIKERGLSVDQLTVWILCLFLNLTILLIFTAEKKGWDENPNSAQTPLLRAKYTSPMKCTDKFSGNTDLSLYRTLLFSELPVLKTEIFCTRRKLYTNVPATTFLFPSFEQGGVDYIDEEQPELNSLR